MILGPPSIPTEMPASIHARKAIAEMAHATWGKIARHAQAIVDPVFLMFAARLVMAPDVRFPHVKTVFAQEISSAVNLPGMTSARKTQMTRVPKNAIAKHPKATAAQATKAPVVKTTIAPIAFVLMTPFAAKFPGIPVVSKWLKANALTAAGVL